MTSAVVFAYHDVGVRCLSVLLAHGITVPLVVTHEDIPSETIWFESVAELAKLHDIPVITPADPNTPEILAQIKAIEPDFLFSLYYRLMLKSNLLALPKRGALNMHGSLLPKYRGRVPVNWAVIKGEMETGATLHYMTEKPDCGDIVDQQAIPILPNDTAFEVFHKVTWTAEIALDRCLPRLLNGTAKVTRQDPSRGAYFGARKPEDGKINWNDTAQNIHNLVRGVAPPYPGAFTIVNGKPLRILRTLVEPERKACSRGPALYNENGRCYAECADGKVLRLVSFELDGKPADANVISQTFGTSPLPLAE